MDEVWMLDYLNAVFPHMGVFPSERHARLWVLEHDAERADYYTPFKVTVNKSGLSTVPHTAPNRRYVNQK